MRRQVENRADIFSDGRLQAASNRPVELILIVQIFQCMFNHFASNFIFNVNMDVLEVTVVFDDFIYRCPRKYLFFFQFAEPFAQWLHYNGGASVLKEGC